MHETVRITDVAKYLWAALRAILDFFNPVSIFIDYLANE
jgi:hypothetical protein